MRNLSKGALRILAALGESDYLYYYGDGRWYIGGRVSANEIYCEELVQSDLLYLSHGTESYIAWMVTDAYLDGLEKL